MREPSNEVGPSGREDTFAIVFVCSGNRFRSPLAEHLMRAATHGLPVHVSSLGTLELKEGPPLVEATELGRELGLDLAAHRSRPLRRELVGEADLVLGFERRHVAHAVVDGGVPRERTFTVPELAGLLRALEAHGPAATAEAARALVAQANALRVRIAREPPDVEIADPYGGTPEAYRRSAEAVRDAVRRIAAGLFGR
jgi:low molecular weight protein-tyrosine phosphatase